MEYLSVLNEKQLEAVYKTEGYLRVIAGAGSGKTKLLVSRYAYLVNEYGIDSANILCVTFTNKAASEMKRRVRALIGDEYDTSLICTYHGFCARVLREDSEKIFYPKEFQIIDTAAQKSILSEIYQKFELKLDYGSFEKITSHIAQIKSERAYVSRMCSTVKCQILDDTSSLETKIIEEYMQRQKQIYAVDFSDLMYFTLYIFSRFPDVLEKWQEKLNYIQIDEFQDSSRTEMELADMLSARHKNLMIVGDPDQNIYEWRGSDVSLLVDFDKTHTPTDTVFLNQNYRSRPEILKCANTLIEKNKLRLEKELFTDNEAGVPVYHYHSGNDTDEAQTLTEKINEIKKETGCNFSDFAVLYRSGFLSRVIEKKFTENGIPYEIFGGVKFYKRMEIQDIMAYIRLVQYDDDISFKRIINTPRRRFGRAKLQRLLELQSGDDSLYTTLKNNIDDALIKNSGAPGFVRVIDNIKMNISAVSLSELINQICSESGYERYIRELGDMERFENLSEFKRIVSEYESSFGENVSLKEFISHIELQSDDSKETASDTVKLMTIHASKGLEFKNVFIIGLTEGIFPSSKAIEERRQLGLEEERRLCYVAITRAKERLILFDSEGFAQNGRQKLPSRFLKDIGEENYIRIGAISKELLEASGKSSMLSDEYVSSDGLSIKNIGDSVFHNIFGKGTITGYSGGRRSYIIKFDSLASERTISVDFFAKADEKKNQTAQASLPKPTLLQNSTPKPTPLPAAVPVLEAAETLEDKSTAAVSASEYENLWNRSDVRKTGWECTGITDLGEPTGICGMCGHQIIRYVHHMVHKEYNGSIGAGCVCAGKMEGNPERARMRENDFKNRQKRRESFMKRKWKISKNNNKYIKIKEHLIILYHNGKSNSWKYSLDNVFCSENFKTSDEAAGASFEALERIINTDKNNALKNTENQSEE